MSAVLGLVSSVPREVTGSEERLRDDMFYVLLGCKTSNHLVNESSDVEICFVFRLWLSRAWSAMWRVCMKLGGSSLLKKAMLMSLSLQPKPWTSSAPSLLLSHLPRQSTRRLVSSQSVLWLLFLGQQEVHSTCKILSHLSQWFSLF